MASGESARLALPAPSAMPSTEAKGQREGEEQLQSPQEHQGAMVMGSGELDLRSLLQALPTRAELETMVTRLKEVHRRDLEVVRTKV